MNTNEYTINYTIRGVEYIQKKSNADADMPCKKKLKYPPFDTNQYKKKETGIFNGKNRTAIRLLFAIAVVLTIIAIILLVLRIFYGFSNA